MLALQITSMKPFMNRLLAGDTFDIFLLEEAVISTANTYTIDGHIRQDFFPPEERTPEKIPYALQPWSELKGLCFNLIKGRYTPLYFKFVFQLKPELMRSLLEQENADPADLQLSSLILTIKYDGGKAVLTTGVSYHAFVLDKTADAVWDRKLSQYLSSQNIPYEIL